MPYTTRKNTDDAKREIVAALTEREVPIIEDDIYGDLHYGSRRPHQFLHLEGLPPGDAKGVALGVEDVA